MTAKNVMQEATTTDTTSQKYKAFRVVCSADLQLVSLAGDQPCLEQ